MKFFYDLLNKKSTIYLIIKLIHILSLVCLCLPIVKSNAVLHQIIFIVINRQKSTVTYLYSDLFLLL
jgi:hypothetical protein